MSKDSQFRINFISSLLCTQGQNLLAGECALLSQGQIGVLFHLSNFTHVQIWYYFRFICRRWGSIFGCRNVSSFLLWMLACFKLPHSTFNPISHKHHRNRHALIFNLTNLYSTFSIFFHLTNEPCSQHCSDPAAEPSAFLGFGLQPPWPVDFVSFVAVLQLIACLSVAVLFSMSFWTQVWAQVEIGSRPYFEVVAFWHWGIVYHFLLLFFP